MHHWLQRRAQKLLDWINFRQFWALHCYIQTSSAKVSKVKVEVVETLYDLARMFKAEKVPLCPEKKSEPLLATKSGSACSSTKPDWKRSPRAKTTGVASPLSSLVQSQQGGILLLFIYYNPQFWLRVHVWSMPLLLFFFLWLQLWRWSAHEWV